MKLSIWTISGRKERIGQVVSNSMLDVLKQKRVKQYTNLVGKYSTHAFVSSKKTGRMEARINYLMA